MNLTTHVYPVPRLSYISTHPHTWCLIKQGGNRKLHNLFWTFIISVLTLIHLKLKVKHFTAYLLRPYVLPFVRNEEMNGFSWNFITRGKIYLGQQNFDQNLTTLSDPSNESTCFHAGMSTVTRYIRVFIEPKNTSNQSCRNNWNTKLRCNSVFVCLAVLQRSEGEFLCC